MKLDELLPQITPLPWFVEPHQNNRIKSMNGSLAVVTEPSVANARYLAHAANHFPAALELIERALLALHEDDFPTLREDLRQFRARATNLPD
jgi:hypothetical protein